MNAVIDMQMSEKSYRALVDYAAMRNSNTDYNEQRSIFEPLAPYSIRCVTDKGVVIRFSAVGERMPTFIFMLVGEFTYKIVVGDEPTHYFTGSGIKVVLS